MRPEPWLLLAVLSCGPKDTDTGTPPPPDTASCHEDTDCEPWQICEGACVDGDRDNDWDSATPILWDDSVTGWLYPGGDVDWYALQAEGGEWVRIDTRPSGTEEGEPVADEDMDTLVELYDPTGKLHAWEDNFPVGSVNTYDSVLYAYLPDEGTWRIAVQDVHTPEGDDRYGGTDWIYSLRVQEFNTHTRESDAQDDPSVDLSPEGSGWLYTVGILLEEPGDRDWIALDLPYDACPLTLQGSAHLEQSEALPRVRLYEPDGAMVLDRSQVAVDTWAYHPGLGTENVLEASDAEGGGSEDHWYILIFSIGDQGSAGTLDGEPVQWQRDGLDDDTPETATVLEPVDLGREEVSYTWGTLDREADVDWFAVEVPDDGYLSVFTGSQATGSLLDAVLLVQDAEGENNMDDREGLDGEPDPAFQDLGPLDGGTWYVGVSAEAECPDWGPGCWYDMAVWASEDPLSD